MTRLKILTTLFIVAGICLLLSWPAVIDPKRPRGRAEIAVYSRRVTVYLGGMLVCMVGAGTGAVLIMRQAREAYRQQATENMRKLVESVRDDANQSRS